MFTKKSPEEKDLVLIQTQQLQEKCGECGGELILKLYWTKDGYQQNIECKSCDLSVWRQLEDEK